MADSCSVSSPRRILSVSKRRKARDEKGPGFGLSGEHGPKPSEVYGFVGSISTVVATAIYLIWAYLPESFLHSLGIYYYPSRYWAVAVPVYVMVSIALALMFYIGLNFLSTPSPTSLHIIFDEFSKEPSISACLEQDQPIQPISDIGINRINELMFNNKK
ncbi:phosphatidylinositol N-acetylglucosaminyltransferase subunit P-like [Cucumis melo var. makuwa]|uniref:Phosphatidylinositol N-acetylglucosaminyltransferase subunit P-like n=1 Tax=Cucumis melo var. makuwa TaxID=1194695 RepID=A0A5A7U6H9_CUCMM|nr:phosphatidylinositol N-acetylglucosaminyltransferase subunit P-like [Cucumis melo var. makuwa]TYK17464.1 phosphatidylinositol N-acetylglucosaminyltransferase subunit P-like [Cucumis melo var. makuwa]